MRYEHLCRSEGIRVFGTGISTDTVQKPLELALRVVKPPCAGPAVRPGINRAVAMGGAHAGKLCSDQPVGLSPAYLHECVRPAFVTRRARATFQPALAHHRGRDPCWAVKHIHNPRPNWRGIWVMLKPAKVGDTTILNIHPVGAPMRRRQQIPFGTRHWITYAVKGVSSPRSNKSRKANFWILPDPVIGKLLTSIQRFGVFCGDNSDRQ